MVKVKNLALATLFTTLGLAAMSQDYMGCDYIRELKVNKEQTYSKPNRRNDFIPFEFKGKDPLSGELRNSLEGKTLNIYYETAKSNLTAGDVSDIRKYFWGLSTYNPHFRIKSYNVEGFADFRGDTHFNYNLSFNRAKNICEKMKVSRPNTIFYLSAYGEANSSETTDSLEMQKDRVVKITPNEHPVKHALDICPADIYLLDQSGSMNKNGEWELLQSYEYPDSSKVYSFSKILGKVSKQHKHTYDIQTEVAFGNTCYYDALDVLLSSLENKTITTRMNGEDNISKIGVEEIIKKANERNVTLNIIGMNLTKKGEKELLEIVKNTQGKYYLFKQF